MLEPLDCRLSFRSSWCCYS